ncbi:hypothetical protein AAC387_Pa09g0720 [Persea americana]
MGLRIEEPATNDTSSSFDALLFTTMCMIGLPVEVQVKDGSVYSGIFHTASVDGEYGVVLKMASMARKGEGNANLSVGTVVDTLVVLSADLVQVVAKGVLIPGDGIVSNVNSDGAKMVASSALPPSCHSELQIEQKTSKSGKAISESSTEEDTEQTGQNGRLNQNEENISVHDLKIKDFKNGFLAKGGKKLGLREGAAKPMESMLEIENGKTDTVDMAKVEEGSSGPFFSDSSDERQDGKGKRQGGENACGTCKDDNMVHGASCSSSPTACIPQLNYIDGMAVKISKILPNGAPSASLDSTLSEVPEHEMPTSVHSRPSDAPTPYVSTWSTSVVNFSLSSCLSPLASPSESVPSKKTVCNTNSKEFKLNPGAKTFSPSFPNLRSTPPSVTAVASVGYGPSSSPMVPIVNAQPGIEISHFTPRTSVPAKFVQYSNLVAGNSGGGTLYGPRNSLPIAGHVGSREQPGRYSSQYQAGSAYVHPNSQTVMVGRLGQVVYVHPIPHDAIQGATTLSQGPARPILAPQQVHLPKQQGTAAQALQVRMTTPYLPAGQQSLGVPGHIPFPQPFPAIRPISVPSINSVFGEKISDESSWRCT